jgi:hypothetical protein
MGDDREKDIERRQTDDCAHGNPRSIHGSLLSIEIAGGLSRG